jgi:aconitate hydratase
MNAANHFLKTFRLDNKTVSYFSLPDLFRDRKMDAEKLPYSIRILVEMLLRQVGAGETSPVELDSLLEWQPGKTPRANIGILPQRVLMQDLTGVPVLNDLASLRAAAEREGLDPACVNPLIPVDLVVDHSVQVDFTGIPNAYQKNLEYEFKRNHERYEFLHWAQGAYKNFRLIPPGTGILHQVNLETLSPMVWLKETSTGLLACPDMVIGTDSHTPMINGLGVLGWGVGGIEAITAMLGNPLELPIPEVIGVRLSGSLPAGVTPTDLTLTIVEKLRALGVVDKFIEFCGPALEFLSVPERAMIANMTPEFGATASYFPVDGQTITYLHQTARPKETTQLAETFFCAQGLFRGPEMSEPEFSAVLECHLDEIEPSIAGPKKPQSRVSLSNSKKDFLAHLSVPLDQGGFGLAGSELNKSARVSVGGRVVEVRHGSVVLAAITSCTNTSDPEVMIAAGILARNALARGLKVSTGVKMSLSPGSRVVTDYLEKAGLLEALSNLGFTLTGFGCMTCIGNSGPLPEAIGIAVTENNLVTAAVLSGNRNFEGRIQPLVKASYLASPPLVVAFALAGRMDLDLTHDPLGTDPSGREVFLKDLWPSAEEIAKIRSAFVTEEAFRRAAETQSQGGREWQALEGSRGLVFQWEKDSNYLREPPFLQLPDEDPKAEIRGARVLAMLGDSVTTDHISPAGAIPVRSPAGEYLTSKGIAPSEYNSYGSRRGNDEVMIRSTLANIRLKNRLVPGVEGGRTIHLPDREEMDIHAASVRYRQEGVPLVVLAGREYGTGSSRDWAAKGVMLLGVRAVIARSFERIHRSNLVGMGVIPLQFQEGESAESLGLTGEEVFALPAIASLKPGGKATVWAMSENGEEKQFQVGVRINSQAEMDTLLQGGILKKALHQITGKMR